MIDADYRLSDLASLSRDEVVQCIEQRAIFAQPWMITWRWSHSMCNDTRKMDYFHFTMTTSLLTEPWQTEKRRSMHIYMATAPAEARISLIFLVQKTLDIASSLTVSQSCKVPCSNKLQEMLFSGKISTRLFKHMIRQYTSPCLWKAGRKSELVFGYGRCLIK